MNVKHTKAFAIVLFKMFMVHLMRPPDGSYVCVPAFAEPFKTLVNDYVMHHKISEAISHHAETDGHQPPHVIDTSKYDRQHARDCENEKEAVIFLKKAWFYLVMIFMQYP